MKCFNLKKLSSLILLILVLGLLLPQKLVMATEKSDIEIKVSYGLDGKFKTYRAIPVNIEVTNNGTAVEGLLEVRVQTSNSNVYDSYGVEATVGKGESKNYSIPITVGENGNRIEVVLYNGKDIVVQKKHLIDTGRVLDHNIIIGTLTDDYNGVSYLGDIKLVGNTNVGPGDIKTVNVSLDENILSSNIRNLDALDILLINNYSTSKLSKDSINNINSWVEQGGAVIIASGENSSKTLSGFKDNLISYEYNSVSEKNINIAGEGVKLNLANINIKDSKEDIKSNDSVLSYKLQKGLGNVYVTTFDLGSEGFLRFANNTEFIKELISEEVAKKNNFNMDKGGDFYRVREMIGTVPLDKEVNTYFFILVFGIYTLIVGLILYFILKKLNKREYIWGVAPIIAILFTIIIYFLGNTTRIKDIVLNQVNIIKVDENGNGIGNGYIGIGSKEKSDLQIHQPNTNIDIKYLSDPYSYYMDPNNNVEAKNLGIRTMYSNNNSYYEFKNSGALDLKPFKISGYTEKLTNFESSVSFNEKGISGYIKNNTSNDVDKLILVVGKNAWDLGSIKDGTEIKLDGNKSLQGSTLESIGQALADDYYRNYRADKTKEEKERLKNVLRYSSFMSALSVETGVETPCIIAFSSKDIDYGLDFDKKSVSKFNTTAIIQKVKVDYKDSEGYSNYPYGHFKAFVAKNDPNAYVEEYMGVVHGSGEVDFEFVIDKHLIVNSLVIGMKDFSGYGVYGNFTADVQIYNYKTDKYEDLSLNNDKEFKLEKPADYLLENILNVKIIYKDEKGAPIPSISVRGRE